MRTAVLLLSAVTALAPLAGVPVRAEAAVAGAAAAQSGLLDPGEISRRLRERLPGRMLSMERQGSNYFVIWAFDDGSIAYLTVDGRTGRIISQRRGDAPRRP